MKQKLHISSGPYFTGWLSQLGAIVAFVMIFCIIFLFVLTEPNWGIFIVRLLSFLIIGAISTNLFLAFEGIEFDFKKHEVRRYRSYLGLRRGEWQSMEELNLLCLTIQFNDSLSFNMANLAVDFPASRQFEINLAGIGERAIMLGEFETHKQAKKQLELLGKRTGLEMRDFYAEHVARQLEKNEIEKQSRIRRR